jgi:leucine dehydrogenase
MMFCVFLGMTYKAAITGLNIGGGKAVIIGDAKTQKTPELMRKFGEFVHSLSGRYITAEDVGMETADMDIVRCYLMLLEFQRKEVELETHHL